MSNQPCRLENFPIEPHSEKDLKVQVANKQEEDPKHASSQEIPYTIFTTAEKRFMAFVISFAALFSPLSSTIYLPALNPLANDLHVSPSKINLSITTFMIFQGLAPAFIGAFSDAEGRRPAYLLCFVIYIAANIGLALQDNYAALMVLRCVQSSGSSGTVALAGAVVADWGSPSERGGWMGYVNAGGLLGPTIGPIIGGALSQYLGWRAIFWFLTIFAGVYLIPIVLIFPETCRAVVGNGSHRPARWNSCLLDPLIKRRVARNPSIVGPPIPPHPLRFPNPLKTLAILFELEAGVILVSTGFMFAGFYGVMAGLPSILERKYGYNAFHIGLCFIASGVGGSLASFSTGHLMDWNFRRHAHKLGLDTSDTRRIRSLTSFPIEAARLEVAFPFVLVGAAAILAFGWLLHTHIHISGPLVFLFLIGYGCTGAFTIFMTLTVDLFPEKAATATAASNMTRCWLGAAATAIVVPMIDAIGEGWTFTFVAGIFILLCPILVGIMRWGPGMRKRKEERMEDGERKE
ncbi:MFS general substrate transporter [Amniculicola lignicola CBS 123094]|uniref:MFS general substrate transporter n=1 Tax=Amniculicola lignicola CBS 123094 TaxID=1392246 RepID=A0A6A5WP54_9PLEO|nr:MFS general substrate transporter [Amniculicola lignicola CBS 123094]